MEEGTPPPLAELESMKVKALKTRAKELGVDGRQLDDADDADDVKGTVIELILAKLDLAAVAADQRLEARLQELREELGAVKSVKALKKRAKDLGVTQEKLDDADDEDDVKGAVIELMVEHTRQREGAESAEDDIVAQEEEALQKLRAELESMKVKALKTRAKELGVDGRQLDDADDADDVKGTVIELIIFATDGGNDHADVKNDMRTAARTTPDADRPHFAGTPSRMKDCIFRDKHCMLSYSWNNQEEVKEIRSLLSSVGVPTWMDIDGGMKTDIYDSMADGVTNAACIVCFMSQAYQDSANCALELKFAKQSGVPIVPIMMEAPDSSGRPWRPNKWLGIITAGTLWTPLWDPSSYAENMPSLLRQIELAVTQEDEDETEYAGDEFTTADARQELERLRNFEQPAAAKIDRSGICALPAQVPDLPEGLRITTEMKQLLSALVTSSNDRIGFCGMGGIGKTTVATCALSVCITCKMAQHCERPTQNSPSCLCMLSGLTRQEATRKQFEYILWVPLGQDPNLQALQQLLYIQLTGSSFEGDQTPETKQELLRQAMVGKNVLLVLDDMWELSHEKLLNFIDDTTSSKVLVSSRIRGLLEGAEIVDVGLPSEDEAVQMLLSVAGLPLDTSVPREAWEVVKLCDRLPLALSIAGRLVSEMGVVGDWEGVVDMMKDEFSDTGQDGSMEERIIRTSLSGIKGPHRDNILRLFHAFAIVPEDTWTPIEMVRMLFEAESETPLPKPPSLINIRRWTKVLIDRSLILGTVDRPSLHDLVMDYVVDAKSDAERRGMNRRLVNLWRSRRPAGGWDIESKESVPSYIRLAAVHHINGAWRSDCWSEDVEAIEWLSDFVDGKVQDAIPVFASEVIGPKRVEQLAKAAEVAEDYWLASLRWAASAFSEHRLGAHGRSLPLLQASAKALARARAQKPKNQLAVNQLEMSVLLLALQSFDPSIDQVNYTARIQSVLEGNQEDFDVFALLALVLFTEIWPAMLHGDLSNFQRGMEKVVTMCMDAIDRVHASDYTQRCLLLCFSCCAGPWFSYGFFPHSIDWGMLFGVHGDRFKDVLHYDYGQMHAAMRPITSFDPVLCYPGWAAAPLTHFGDISAANAAFDHMLPLAFRCLDEWSPPSASDIWYLKSVWPLWLYFLGRKKDARAVLHAGPYDELPPQFDWIAKAGGALWRPRGVVGDHPGILGADDFLAHAQFLDVLVADELPASEILAALPELEPAAMLGVLCSWGSISNYHFSTVLVAMLAHERLGSTTSAMKCAGIILEAELTMGGTTSKQRHSLAHATRGRILAAQGKLDEAEAAFEAAIEVANCYGGYFFSALAMRDLCKHVLGGTTRSEEGTERLEAMVVELACNVEDMECIVYP